MWLLREDKDMPKTIGEAVKEIREDYHKGMKIIIVRVESDEVVEAYYEDDLSIQGEKFNYWEIEDGRCLLEIGDKRTAIEEPNYNGNPDHVMGLEYYDLELENILIPEYIVTIGPDAYSWNKLTEVTIPKNVKYIGLNAFSGNHNLTKVVFMGNKVINSNAFPKCTVFYDSKGNIIEETEEK